MITKSSYNLLSSCFFILLLILGKVSAKGFTRLRYNFENPCDVTLSISQGIWLQPVTQANFVLHLSYANGMSVDTFAAARNTRKFLLSLGLREKIFSIFPQQYIFTFF